jgi:hypothetical protein
VYIPDKVTRGRGRRRLGGSVAIDSRRCVSTASIVIRGLVVLVLVLGGVVPLVGLVLLLLLVLM